MFDLLVTGRRNATRSFAFSLSAGTGYFARGTTIIYRDPCGDELAAACCEAAQRAAELLNAAQVHQYRRRYTAAARQHAEAMSLPGFRWLGAWADVVEDAAHD